MLARFTGRHWTAAAAVITVAAAGFGAAAVRMFFAVPGQRIAIVMLVARAGGCRTAAPAIGLRLARVPRQSFGSITGRDLFARAPGQPEDTVSPVESAPHDITLRGEQVAEVALPVQPGADRNAAGCRAWCRWSSSWFAIDPGHGTPMAVVTVVGDVALILVLRARALRDRRHAITWCAGRRCRCSRSPRTTGLPPTPAATATGLWAAAAVLAVALAALLAGAVVPVAHLLRAGPPDRRVPRVRRLTP